MDQLVTPARVKRDIACHEIRADTLIVFDKKVYIGGFWTDTLAVYVTVPVQKLRDALNKEGGSNA